MKMNKKEKEEKEERAKFSAQPSMNKDRLGPRVKTKMRERFIISSTCYKFFRFLR